MNTFGESMNTFGESMNTFGVSLNTSYRRAMEARCYLRHNRRCAVRTIGYFSRRSAIFCNEGAPVVGLSTAQVAHCIFTSVWLLGFVCFLLNILYLKAKSTADLCIQIKIFGSGSGLNIQLNLVKLSLNLVKPQLSLVKLQLNLVKPQLNLVKPQLNLVKPWLNCIQPQLNLVKPQYSWLFFTVFFWT